MGKTRNLLRIHLSAMVIGSMHTYHFRSKLRLLVRCTLGFAAQCLKEERKALVKGLRAVARQLGVDQIRDDCGRSKVQEWFQTVVKAAKSKKKPELKAKAEATFAKCESTWRASQLDCLAARQRVNLAVKSTRFATSQLDFS